MIPNLKKSVIFLTHQHFLPKIHLSEDFPTNSSNSSAQKHSTYLVNSEEVPLSFIFCLLSSLCNISLNLYEQSLSGPSLPLKSLSRSPSKHLLMFYHRPPWQRSQEPGGLSWPQLFASQTLFGSLTFAVCSVTGVGSCFTEDFLINSLCSASSWLCPAKAGGSKEMTRRELVHHACRNLCYLFNW